MSDKQALLDQTQDTEAEGAGRPAPVQGSAPMYAAAPGTPLVLPAMSKCMRLSARCSVYGWLLHEVHGFG